MPLTQEAILGFLLARGGKVRNSELLNHFRGAISSSDPAEKQHNRELFKKLVNSVAVVKQIDEVKFVVVKKRYQDFVRDAPRDVAHKTHADDSGSSANSSFSCASPRRSGAMSSDAENNNPWGPSPSHSHVNGCGARVDSTQKRRMSPGNARGPTDTTTVKVLNIRGDQASRVGESGAVFAVIAVKSPPRDPHHGPRPRKTADKQGVSARASFPSKPSVCTKGAPRASQSCRVRPGVDQHPPTAPQVSPPTKSTKPADEHTPDHRCCDSVPLEPLAHEWLVKCAAGRWGHIHTLLQRDARLAHKKDFMCGFTALHWAAKDGNGEMIRRLMDVSQRRGVRVDVNSRAHGGYTPLHIAAIHGRTEVMVLLVRSYGANVKERDYDGKKALHYLGTGASAEVRALMGGAQQRGKSEEEEDSKEQAKSFNTISKLFQPHAGKKQKTKFAHDW